MFQTEWIAHYTLKKNDDLLNKTGFALHVVSASE